MYRLDENWVEQNFDDITNVRVMAGGGQKIVFSALHKSDGEVVLKLIKPNNLADRVLREIRAVQLIGSPRVPRIFQSGSKPLDGEEILWIREQRIDGNTVRVVINQGRLAVPEVMRLAIHILEALVSAESQRIVHRDVKPENIVRDTAGDFWLLDFGISRHLDLDSLTPDMAPYGPSTIGYAPPEQYKNLKRQVDTRADLFALGVTLYEAFTTIQPFRDGSSDAWETWNKIETKPIDMRVIAETSHPRIAEFLRTLMQPRPDHRPRSAVDALEWARELAGIV